MFFWLNSSFMKGFMCLNVCSIKKKNIEAQIHETAE